MSRDGKLKSERMSVAAPMSFTGSAQRLWRIGIDVHPAVRWALLVPLLALLIALAWTAVSAWYLTFGLLLVPYRLVRRGSRKRKLEGRRHRETLDTLRQSSSQSP